MKRKLFFVLLALTSVFVFAQPQPGGPRGGERPGPGFNPEEFNARMDGFIIKKAQLSESEAKAVLPIFREMKDKQREIMHRIMKLKHDAKPQDNQQAEKAVLEIVGLEKQSSTLENTYYKKMCKAVPATKVFRLILAEDEFHRTMLENFNRKRHITQKSPK